MPVLRNSAPLTAQAPTNRGVQQLGPGNAPLQMDRFASKSPTLPPGVQGTDVITTPNFANTQILSGIFGIAGQIGEAKMKQGLTNAMLAGAAAAASGKTAESIQADPLTKDWVTAGFNDTTAKLMLAKSEADLQAQMPKLRELDPAAFARVLAERRQELLPKLGPMSAHARESMLAQMVSSDAAAIQQHGQAHTQFILDAKTEAIQANMTSRAALLTASQGTPAYGSQVAAYATALHANTFGDDMMPKALQGKLLYEGLHYAIGTGNYQAYEAALTTTVPFPDGSKGTIISRMPLDAQLKLGAAYRKGREGKDKELQFNLLAGNEQVEADIKDPTKAMPAYGDYEDFQRKLVQSGALTPSAAASNLGMYHVEEAKRTKSSTASAMWQANDVGGLRKYGMTENDGAKATVDGWLAGGMPISDVATRLGSMASQGRVGAMKQLGPLMVNAYKQLGNSDTLTPDAAALLVTQNGIMDKLEAQGQTGAWAEYISGMPDAETAKLAMLYRSALGNAASGTPEERSTLAAKHARTAYTNWQLMNPAARASVQSAANKEVEKTVATLSSRSHLMQAWDRVTNFFGAESTEGKLSPDENRLFGRSTPAVSDQKASLTKAVREEMYNLVELDPNTPADTLLDTAFGQVLGRTIQTADHGNLILPKNTSMATFFGLDPKTQASQSSKDMIGRGVSRWLADKGYLPDDDIALETGADGGLVVRKYTPDGMALEAPSFDPKEVGQSLLKMGEEDGREQAKLTAMGGRGANGIRYDGANAAGVPETVAFAVRRNLNDNEGARLDVYKDTKGVLTTSIGVSEKSDAWIPGLKEGDTVTRDQASSMFAAATNTALVQAWSLQGAVGVPGARFTELLAELAYQGGDPGRKSAVLKMLTAAKKGQPEEARKFLTQTAPFQASGSARQEHYVRMLERAIATLPKQQQE